jgi:hypothetical protein
VGVVLAALSMHQNSTVSLRALATIARP